LVILLAEEFVGAGRFFELVVDAPVFLCECFEVLSHFCHLLRFQLGKRCLLVQLISQRQDFALQMFDLGLQIEHLAVQVVLSAGGDAHLVLDVAEFVALTVKLLL